VFVPLLFTPNHVVFFIAVCYVILCYGGGFGSMPSLVADTFGPKAMAKAYGAVLTAWGAAGVVGPLAAAYIRDRIPGNFGPYLFGTAVAVLTLGFAVSYLDPGHGTKGRKGSA
jgi:OFA family oxalate/formate antiporter-like MFS transporter